MACDIFGVYDYDDAEEVCEASSDHYEQEDLPMEEVWYQAELPLENVREMEERHLREIKKFERAYRKMCHNALKWHYLMEDLKDNEQLKKMFNDIQLMRKLGGSEGV
jgi:tRNA-dihydrouridine synthase